MLRDTTKMLGCSDMNMRIRRPESSRCSSTVHKGTWRRKHNLGKNPILWWKEGCGGLKQPLLQLKC